jgi:Mg-chelatase subunit ChlD
MPLIEITSTEMAVLSLQKLRSCGGTDLAAGLKVAWDVLEPQLSQYRAGRIIFLTDGQGGNPIRLAKEIKSRGVLVETIGFAGIESEVNESLLKKVATTDGNGFTHYWFFKDTQSLVTHYEELATGVFFRGHKE